MFMKQYNYKPRSNSTSSQDGSQAGSPPKDDSSSTSKTAAAAMGQTTSPTAAAAARRRSSASEKFAGLNAYKRGSGDDTTAAKKASFSEMTAGNNGILGGMWNSFTKGQGK